MKRDYAVNLRLSASEKTALDALVLAGGFDNVSDCLRELLRRESGVKTIQLLDDDKAVKLQVVSDIHLKLDSDLVTAMIDSMKQHHVRSKTDFIRRALWAYIDNGNVKSGTL